GPSPRRHRFLLSRKRLLPRPRVRRRQARAHPCFARTVRSYVPIARRVALAVEGSEQTAHLWAPRLGVVMVESMREYTPDVRVDAPPALMRRWWKGAEPTYITPTGHIRGARDAKGKLTLHDPKPGDFLIPWDDRDLYP